MKTKIILEVGVNHNGSIKIAKKLIDYAKESGADYVKFQSFITDELVLPNTKLAKYQKKNIGKKISQYDIKKYAPYVHLIEKYNKKYKWLKIN